MSLSSRAGLGWQTSLADLSLILFMVTAAAVDPDGRPAPDPAAPSRQAEPLAIYEAVEGTPPLSVWLDRQAADPRQQLTVTAQYGNGTRTQAEALAQAARLLEEAGRLGRRARLVVEPGHGPARVVLAYDVPEPPVSNSSAPSPPPSSPRGGRSGTALAPGSAK